MDICFGCGDEGNYGKKIKECKNCNEDHITSSRVCPIWIMEKEIQEVKLKEVMFIKKQRIS